MKLVALKNFAWAHGGVRVEEFEKDQVIETEDPDLIKVAVEEKWAKAEGKQTAKSEGKAKEEKPVETTNVENPEL